MSFFAVGISKFLLAWSTSDFFVVGISKYLLARSTSEIFRRQRNVKKHELLWSSLRQVLYSVVETQRPGIVNHLVFIYNIAHCYPNDFQVKNDLNQGPSPKRGILSSWVCRVIGNASPIITYRHLRVSRYSEI